MMYRAAIMSIATLMILGCNGNSNTKTGSDGISDVEIRDAQTIENRDVSFELSIKSNVDVKNVPVNYFLVSEEEKIISTTSNEENETVESEPVYQFYIGSSFLDLNSSKDITKDFNFSLKSDIPAGNYKVIAYIDPKNSKNLEFAKGTPIYNGEVIEIKPAIADVAILSAKLDDNVLLISENQNANLMATIQAKSYLGNINNTYLKAKLIWNNQDYDLSFYENDTLTNELNVSLSEESKNIALTLQLPQDIKDELYDALDDNIQNAKIEFTLVSTLENEPLENNKKTLDVSLYKNKQIIKRIIPTSEGNVILRSFNKDFNADKGYNDGSRFGVLLSSNASANFATLDSDANVNGSLHVKILGNKIDLFSLGISGFVQYDSFEDTGYLIKMDLLNRTVFLKSDDVANMAEYESVPKAELTDEEKEANLTEAEKNKILSKRQIILNANPDTKSILGYENTFSYPKEIIKSQTIMVSIVPVTVSAGIQGDVGFKVDMGLQGILSLEAEMGPFAYLGGYASGAVGVVGFRAGIEGSFSFIDNYFHGSTGFRFEFDGDENDLRLKGILSENIGNTFKGPNGSLNLFAEYTVPRTCSRVITYCNGWSCGWHGCYCSSHGSYRVWYPCGVTTYHPTYNIFNWRSFTDERTLLDEEQTLTDIKIY